MREEYQRDYRCVLHRNDKAQKAFVGDKDGILHVTVDLAGAEGRVLYDTTKRGGGEVAEMIDSMKYDCSLIGVVGAFSLIHFKAFEKEHFRRANGRGNVRIECHATKDAIQSIGTVVRLAHFRQSACKCRK